MFHVSQKDHGKVWRPTPRVPERTMTGEDKTTPRVCVCPTVRQCLMAIDGIGDLRFSGFLHSDTGWFVYETDEECYKPDVSLVPDFDITSEHWVTDKRLFSRVGVVRYSSLLDEIYVEFSGGGTASVERKVTRSRASMGASLTVG